MRLSYKWLNEYVSLEGISPLELAEKMTTAGLEVEGLEPLAQGTGLVIGEVLECVDHPDSDHLHITTTRIGDKPEDVHQIVCGAPNIRKGLKVIVADDGAELLGGKIGARPVRGVDSCGMICSLNELGVDKKFLRDDQINGIEELPQDAPVGCKDVLGYLGLDDTILDVSLTPNRADCSAMWNMAKEVGAILNREVKWPSYEGKAECGTPSDFKVETKTENCSLFYGKVVNDVTIKPSPIWMQNYLRAAGMNAINNLVDISNFVMLETGQPLHFYDLRTFENHELTVVDDLDEKFVALDGNEFEVKPNDIMITTNGSSIGIAGVMGGEGSMVQEDTKGIFIEAAHFSHVSIRKTSLRLNLVTEAAQRFTKGLEPLSVEKAMNRAVQLLVEYADAKDLEETVKAGSEVYTPVVVDETLSHCNALLGTEFTMDQVSEVLTKLDFKPEINGDKITSHIPSYRVDIACSADIDEEIIRMIGFDSLKASLPTMKATVGKLSKRQSLRRLTRTVLAGLNLNEIITYTLVNDQFIEQAFMPKGDAVALAMPMSEARKYVRTSLINSVLECVQYNNAHGNSNNCFYEISKVYAKGVDEERLAIVLDGNLMQDRLHKIEVQGDFYCMKGIITEWLKRQGYNEARIKIKENKTDLEHFHPYRSAEIYIDRNKLGVFGEIHPAFAKQYDLKHVTYAELNMEVVLQAKTSKVKFEAVDKYPSVSRDIAIVVENSVKAEDIIDIIRKTGKKLVRSTEIFDIYEGEHVEEGKKSIALRIIYQASDHTLKEDEVTTLHTQIVENLEKKLNAELRG